MGWLDRKTTKHHCFSAVPFQAFLDLRPWRSDLDILIWGVQRNALSYKKIKRTTFIWGKWTFWPFCVFCLVGSWVNKCKQILMKCQKVGGQTTHRPLYHFSELKAEKQLRNETNFQSLGFLSKSEKSFLSPHYLSHSQTKGIFGNLMEDYQSIQ